jgi:hypothetical protein
MSELDPLKVIAVCKRNGKEVGRIPAAAPKATEYIGNLVRHGGGLTVDYVENADEIAGWVAVNGPLRKL